MGQTVAVVCLLLLCLAGILELDHVAAENVTSSVTAISTSTTISPKSGKFSYHIQEKSDLDSPVTVNLSVPVNCMLKAENDTVFQTLQTYLNDNVKLVIYRLSIRNKIIQIQDRNTLMYQPYHWVRSTGRHGTGLLLLRPEYKAYSLFTLSYGVKTMHVNLIDEPVNCASEVPSATLEYLVRNLLLADFQNNSSADAKTVNQEELVCNMHMINKSETAYFRYHCCRRYEASLAECRYLEADLWRKVLQVVILILKIIVILFAPRFAPAAWYQLKKIALPFTYKLQKEVKIKTVVTSDKTNHDLSRCKTIVKYSHLQQMEKFCETLKKMKRDIPYVFTLPEINLAAQGSRLLPDNSAPVGIFPVLYNALFRCSIRNKTHLQPCCNASVLCYKQKGVHYEWYKFLKKVMGLAFAVLIALPWVIRLFAYFSVEKDEMTERKDFAEERGLNIYFPGTVTLYLTPIHVVFICTYILLVIDSCLFGVVSKYTRERLRFVLRKCFQDMHETRKLELIGWMFSWIVWPCEKLGFLGLVVSPFYIIPCLMFTVTTLLFYVIPTVNITFRLLAHFFYYMFPRRFLKKNKFCRGLSEIISYAEENVKIKTITSRHGLVKDDNVLRSTLKRITQLIIIFVCLISLYSILFLFMELISFAVEILVYTVIGLILNADQVLTFVSFLILLGVYARDSFGNVSDSYLEYNKVLHDAILQHGTKDSTQALGATENPEKCVAFRVTSDSSKTNDQEAELCTRDGFLRWTTKSLLLFIGREAQPLIPTDFFFKACHMKYYNVPGSATLRYLRATLEFITIIIFLLFVMLVVLAFGDSYNLSVSNQILASLAGGFLPFALKNFVFKSFKEKGVNVGDIYFKACIGHEMDTFTQEWPVDDIDANLEEADITHAFEPWNNKTSIAIEKTQNGHVNDVQEDTPLTSMGETVADIADIDLLVIATEDELELSPLSTPRSSSEPSDLEMEVRN